MPNRDAKVSVYYVFRQQLQELRLKQEQRERHQRGGRRRDLQGETAGETVRPRREQPPDSNSDCDLQPVRRSCHVRCSVHMSPQEGVKQPLSRDDECFIYWLTPERK